jgi:tRNA modification GTPase
MAGAHFAHPATPESPEPETAPPSSDTICAPATAPGQGAVGIVRLSGPKAIALAAIHFRSSGSTDITAAPSHTVHHGHLLDSHGTVVDEVLLILMRAPRSYTTEDVVEIQCHGGGASVRAAMDCLIAAGCRMADPGEFTRRAFLNGRIDLAQAEAVLEVIGSRTELQQRLAQRQLAGSLSDAISDAGKLLRQLAAHMEAAIDFPEDDLSQELPDDTLTQLDAASSALADIAANAQAGALVKEGVRLAILGRPNVGKSSLLNRLLGYDRAIVADQPGTTRDVLEAELAIDGVRFIIQDTAGIRQPGDAIEAQGVERSHQAAAGADLILLVLDASAPLEADDQTLLDKHPNAVIAINKSDLTTTPALPSDHQGTAAIAVSAHTGQGIDALRTTLLNRVHGPEAAPLEHAFLVTSRQQQALQKAAQGVTQTRQGVMDNAFPELIAADLRCALDSLGEISGETTADDLLNLIFSEFCIGK